MFHSKFWSRLHRRRLTVIGITAVLLASIFLAAGAYAQTVIPLIFIESVVEDDTVRISTRNFPAGQSFAVTMGVYGSRGINGYFVESVDSGPGGNLSFTFDVPDALQGRDRIAIRLQSRQGYYSFNWFYNNTTLDNIQAGEVGEGVVGTGGEVLPATVGYTGIPTFSIVSVDPGNSVTLRTNNYPANQTFNVTMGRFGTRGINGEPAGRFNSEGGGSFEVTINIPEAVRNLDTIAIRAQTGHANPYYSFNYFANGEAGLRGGSDNPNQVAPVVYTGIPTIHICQVVRNSSVTFEARNFPPNFQFDTYVGSVYADSFPSQGPAAFRHTSPVPITAGAGSKVAIRTTTQHANPFYSYNWFYNTTTSSDFC